MPTTDTYRCYYIMLYICESLAYKSLTTLLFFNNTSLMCMISQFSNSFWIETLTCFLCCWIFYNCIFAYTWHDANIWSSLLMSESTELIEQKLIGYLSQGQARVGSGEECFYPSDEISVQLSLTKKSFAISVTQAFAPKGALSTRAHKKTN